MQFYEGFDSESKFKDYVGIFDSLAPFVDELRAITYGDLEVRNGGASNGVVTVELVLRLTCVDQNPGIPPPEHGIK